MALLDTSKLKLSATNIFIAVGVIMAAAFYFGVWNYYQMADEQRRLLADNEANIDKIMKKPAEVPSELWVRQANEYTEKLKTEIAACKDYYQQKDKPIEAWFSGLTLGQDGLPEQGDFKVRYVDEKDRLIKQLKDKKIRIGIIGAEETEPAEEDKTPLQRDAELGFEEPTKQNLAGLQKRFWMQKELVEVMLKSGVTNCEKMTFGPSGGASAPKGPKGAVTVSTANRLTANLGSAIPFELKVAMHNKDIAGFIHNLLKISETGFLVTVKKIEVSRVAKELANYPEIKEPEQPVPLDKKEGYKTPEIAPPLVRLVLHGEALDFETTDEHR